MSEKETKLTNNAKQIKVTYYSLLHFEQFFKKMQDQAILMHSDNTTTVYKIGKWKAKESLIKRIKQVFYLVKKLKLQITTIHIPGKLNSTTDSLSRLYRSGDYTVNDGIIQMICKTWNYMPQIDVFATYSGQSLPEDEIRQIMGINNSSDLAGTIVIRFWRWDREQKAMIKSFHQVMWVPPF
ncbi:MAG: hypothetical protein EZS28_006787 [Streblomastix strix]|uniref:Uncharacterized protein n=1 Tax=Streblomastix strix TaxID=222440 RepID=A0A5J4WRY7_9EUKA|nr:MAG: hypothetical protein EZS28_006787 [Streblomastix strix]